MYKETFDLVNGFSIDQIVYKNISEGLYIVSKANTTLKFPKGGTFRYIFFDFLFKTSNFFIKHVILIIDFQNQPKLELEAWTS